MRRNQRCPFRAQTYNMNTTNNNKKLGRVFVIIGCAHFVILCPEDIYSSQPMLLQMCLDLLIPFQEFIVR